MMWIVEHPAGPNETVAKVRFEQDVYEVRSYPQIDGSINLYVYCPGILFPLAQGRFHKRGPIAQLLFGANSKSTLTETLVRQAASMPVPQSVAITHEALLFDDMNAERFHWILANTKVLLHQLQAICKWNDITPPSRMDVESIVPVINSVWKDSITRGRITLESSNSITASGVILFLICGHILRRWGKGIEQLDDLVISVISTADREGFPHVFPANDKPKRMAEAFGQSYYLWKSIARTNAGEELDSLIWTYFATGNKLFLTEVVNRVTGWDKVALK